MGLNGAINTRAIATVDGIRLDEGGAETILLLFRSLSLENLPIVAIGAIVLWRWRAMVPFLFLVLFADQIGRRLLALVNPIARTEAGAVAVAINIALLALLFVGFVLSLWDRSGAHAESPVDGTGPTKTGGASR